MAPTETVLLSWIHLSDIHARHGDATTRGEQEFVVDALCEDVEQLLGPTGNDLGIVPPELLLVTGDLGATGGDIPSKDNIEYSTVRSWILRVGDLVGITTSATFTIPGNHDVQWSADTNDSTVGSTVRELRRDKSLDEILQNVAGKKALRPVFQG